MRNIDALQNLFSKLLLCCIGSNHKSWPFVFAILLMASGVAQATTQDAEGLPQHDITGGLAGSANNNWLKASVAAATSAATAAPMLARCPLPAQCIPGALTLGAGIMQFATALDAGRTRDQLTPNSRNYRDYDPSGQAPPPDLDLTSDTEGDITSDSLGGGAGSHKFTPFDTSSDLLQGLSNRLDQLKQTMANHGYFHNLDDDTLTTPHGTFPIDQINSLDKMQKAGLLSAADRPAAEAALKAAQEKGRRRAEKFLKAARKEARSGRSSIKSLKFNKPKAGLRSSFYFQGKKKLSGPRKALSRNIAGEQVGVSSDGLFYMIHRKYQTQSKELLKR